MNPKNVFLKNLIIIINDFEISTGVYVQSIDFERFRTKDNEDISDKSVITSIKLNFE